MNSRAALEQAFSISITPLQQAWRVAANAAIPTELGLSLALSWPLVVIFNEGGRIRQQDLVRKLGLEKSTLARTVEQLVAAALIERVADRDNRRSNILELTSEGNRLGAQLEPIVRQFRASALSDVSDDELKTCLSVFARLSATLEVER